MTLDELRLLKEFGEFHHATYRYEGAKGLHVYAKDPIHGFRGYRHVGSFYEMTTDKATMNAAYEIVRDSGVSVGSYGN